MESQYSIIIFYKYTPVPNPGAFRKWGKEIGAKLGLKGRIHIAEEGINATVEGLTENIHTFMEEIRKQEFADLKDADIKISAGYGEAFPNLKVKVKPEIVALKLTEAVDENGNPEEDVDPSRVTGIHLTPAELKALYEKNEDFVMFDMRNDYEYRVGHFKDAINPKMNNFRDLPKVLPKIIESNPEIKKKKVIAYCSAGVRCEKASAYLIKKGFENVYQLDGGIQRYMEKFPGNKDKGELSEYRGALYAFDNRITMDFNGGEPREDAATNPEKREIVGKCQVCQGATERYDHCANDVCHLHLLICEDCAKNHVYVWCSKDCQENGRIGLTPASELDKKGALITG